MNSLNEIYRHVFKGFIGASIMILTLSLACTPIHSISTKRQVNEMLKLHAKMLGESQLFLSEEKQRGFNDSLLSYLKTCKEYNFFNNVRMEPYFTQPIFLNEKRNKVIVMVLSRTLDKAKNRVEYVNYVSGKINNKTWEFKVYTVRSDSFGYSENYPTLSDTEISLDILGRLVRQKLIDQKNGSTEVLFNSDFYTIK